VDVEALAAERVREIVERELLGGLPRELEVHGDAFAIASCRFAKRAPAARRTRSSSSKADTLDA